LSSKYYKITIKEENLHQEINDYLWKLGCMGIEEQETHVEFFFQGQQIEIEKLVRLIKTTFHANTIHSVDVVADKNWNQIWESNFHPIQLRDYCVVYAPFHSIDFSLTKHAILITPEMAFGTGHHATTRMMIDLMSDINLEGKVVMDFGSGTGILAILAKKEKASEIVAVEHDEHPFHVMKQNLVNNQCAEVVSVHGTITDVKNQSFDVIVANITRNVLLENKQEMYDRLTGGGLLLCSGYLVDDQNKIVDEFEALGMQVIQTLQKNNWSSAIFRKQ